MGTPGTAARYARELLQIDPHSLPKEPYIKPSSLARGCLLYVAFELRGEPKLSLDARVGRILSVGTDSHRRLQRALGRACLGQEVFFEVPEYRIHGFCDGILYARPDRTEDGSEVRFLGIRIQDDSLGRIRRDPVSQHAQRGAHSPGADLPVGTRCLLPGNDPTRGSHYLL